jgi:hypothetical protein
LHLWYIQIQSYITPTRTCFSFINAKIILSNLFWNVPQERDSLLLGYDAAALGNQISAFRGNVLKDRNVEEERSWCLKMRTEHCFEISASGYPRTSHHIPENVTSSSPSIFFLDGKIKFLSHTKEEKKWNILMSAFYVVAAWRRILNWRELRIKWNLFVFYSCVSMTLTANKMYMEMWSCNLVHDKARRRFGP